MIELIELIEERLEIIKRDFLEPLKNVKEITISIGKDEIYLHKASEKQIIYAHGIIKARLASAQVFGFEEIVSQAKDDEYTITSGYEKLKKYRSAVEEYDELLSLLSEAKSLLTQDEKRLLFTDKTKKQLKSKK